MKKVEEEEISSNVLNRNAMKGHSKKGKGGREAKNLKWEKQKGEN